MARLTDSLLSAKPANQIECERDCAGDTTNLRCVRTFNYLQQTFMFFVPGWQGVSSYDQLSSTGYHDTASSSLLSSHSRPSASKPSSISRPLSRARLSEARTPAPEITNPDVPLFNKTNPMQFLDIMKGVSARLNENAGVRPRREFNLDGASSSSRAKKRTRGVSLGGTSELQARKATCGIIKKGRMDELRTSGTYKGKEKGRAMPDLDSEVRGRGLQAHSSLPDIPSRSDLKPSLSSKNASFMDVDDKEDDMNAEHISRSIISSSSNHDCPDIPFARTLSQTEMPPPPLPCNSFAHKQRQPTDPPREQSNSSSISTPLAVSRHSNSNNKPHTSCLPQQQPPAKFSIKQQKSDATPKLHPLLYHKPATTEVPSSSTVTPTPQVQPQHHPASIPALEGVNSKPTPSPSSSTPLFSSTPASRPPPLGMRRNHTFPSRTSSSSTVQQESSSLFGSGGQLPQRQKGFKPPLLSLSQPQAQTQTQTHGSSRVKANANAIVESVSTIATSKKVSSPNLLEALSTDNRGVDTTTNISMALWSSTSSSDSPASFPSTPPIQSAPSCPHSPFLDSSVSKSNECSQGTAQQPQKSVVIPEPLDGDADSSFGDMSFDMDALEETMKMYD